MADKPAAEVRIDEALVRSLLAAQAPAMASLPLQLLAEGWDNEIWALGDAHAVRLPRRQPAVVLVENEQRWLPDLAPVLPVPIPLAVVEGRPGEGYPWPWSVVEWFPGDALGDRPGSARTATQLGAFLRALHQPAPAAAPANPYRGVDLAARAEVTERWFDTIAPLIDAETHQRLRDVLANALDAPTWDAAPVWLHGDLHPLNLVVLDDDLSAVIDFGDITSGDPASDLAVAWMAFEPAERARFQAELPHVDAATWTRAHGWAVSLGATILANSDDVPAMERVARAIIARTLDT